MPIWTTNITKYERVELQANEWFLVTHLRDPKKNHIVCGPCMYELTDPWEVLNSKETAKTIKLNEFALLDDIRDPNLNAFVFGPLLWKPENQFQKLLHIQPQPVLDANDYLVVRKCMYRPSLPRPHRLLLGYMVNPGDQPRRCKAY
jgi:hypothetical protein